MLRLVILAASVLGISCGKKQWDRQTDRQTNCDKNPTPATVVGVSNDVTLHVWRAHFNGLETKTNRWLTNIYVHSHPNAFTAPCLWVSRLILCWPSFQYSRRSTEWPRSTRSPAVAMWKHLRPTSIQNNYVQNLFLNLINSSLVSNLNIWWVNFHKIWKIPHVIKIHT